MGMLRFQSPDLRCLVVLDLCQDLWLQSLLCARDFLLRGGLRLVPLAKVLLLKTLSGLLERARRKVAPVLALQLL